jgi:hypothetical protein
MALPRYLFVTLLLLLFAGLSAQERFTISGYIKDATNGETMIGAIVSQGTATNLGASSNIYGFYSLTLPAGKYRLQYSYVGYTSIFREIDLNSDLRLNIDMFPDSKMLEELVITGARTDENVKGTEMGTIELTMEKIKSIPSLFGEVDIIKALQLLPGVVAAGEGNSGMYVRGGGPDQNLVLLDDAIVYNTGHLFGFFSVFNSDAVKSTTLIKGGMPASYGGRLSSVVDVAMKEGNNKRFQMDGGIGLISSRITLQGPIQKEKSSFLFAARRTYAFDLAQPFLNKTDFAGTNYYFYDLNVKANYIFSDKDRLYLSGYFGRDVFFYNSVPNATSVKIPWGNATTTLRWNHLFNDKLFMNTSFIFNNYKFEFNGEQTDFKFDLFSGIRDLNLKLDLDHYARLHHKMKYGFNYTYHTFTPSTAEVRSGDEVFKTTESKKHAHEMAVYYDADWDISEKVRMNYGMRVSLFQHVGPYTEIIGDNVFQDTITYNRLKPIKTFVVPEPRVAIRYAFNGPNSIKAGVNYNAQYVHLVSTSNGTLPTDVWVPSSKLVAPQTSLQYAVGYFRNFKDNMYEFSVEGYFKHLFNQIEYGESEVQEFNVELEKSFAFGRGKAYGLELFLKKRTGALNGWVGYTLARSDRKFAGLNQGNTFPAKFDRTHDISINITYDINEKWQFGTTWVYATGNAFTLPVERYFIEFGLSTGYGDRNGYRLPAYHRMDLSVNYTPNKKPNKRFKSTYNFSVYNVYNRRNTYFIYYKVGGDIITGDLRTKAVNVSIFPVIPSFTWNFKF